MTEFNNLKRSYITVIQLSLGLNTPCEEVKRGNDILHRFCENLVENSVYPDDEKRSMKNELEIVKGTIAQEIEAFYQKH